MPIGSELGSMSSTNLPSHSIQIWHCEVRSGIDWDSLTGLKKLLSPTEQTLIPSFSHAPQKFEFIISKALLRNRLSFYLQQTPSEISIITEEKGRPKLEVDSNLRFNVSHSKGLISCAFSNAPELGIDIENLTRNADYGSLASDVFSPKELQTLTSYSKTNQPEVFFKIWTLKEAYLKALGTGVVDQIKEITLELDPAHQAASLKETFLEIDHGKDWNFYLSQPTPNHQLALAYRWPPVKNVSVKESFITLNEIRNGTLPI